MSRCSVAAALAGIEDAADPLEGSAQQVAMLARLKADWAHVANCVDERCLAHLEARFEVHLPCFQGKAHQYDPLDAMRRDAYREMCLYLRQLREKYKP